MRQVEDDVFVEHDRRVGLGQERTHVTQEVERAVEVGQTQRFDLDVVRVVRDGLLQLVQVEQTWQENRRGGNLLA